MIEAAVTVSTTFDVILLCGSLFLEGHVFALEANLGDNNFWCFHWLIFALNNGILACGNIDRSDLKFILCLMCGVSQPRIDNFHTKEFYRDLCQSDSRNTIVTSLLWVSPFQVWYRWKSFTLKHVIQQEAFCFSYACCETLRSKIIWKINMNKK